MTPTYHRQRGAVAVMVAVAMLVLIAVVGLVVDGGLAFMVKARLNAAVDSAALAAARAVPAGATEAAQRASAEQAAAQFFAANIPDGYLLSKPVLKSTEITFNAGTVTIDVTAEAPMPVSLMQVLGFKSLTPVAYAQTIRKDLDMAFVVDTSGSLDTAQNSVRAAAKSFLNKFSVSQDRVSLIHFASGSEVDNPIRTSARGFDRTSMSTKIDAFEFQGATSSVEGMWQARNQLNSIPTANRSSLRVIVFFSDGQPNSLGAYLTFNSGRNCTTPGILNVGGAGLFALNESTGTSIRNCELRGPYDQWLTGNSNVITYVKKLPDWYNPRNIKDDPALREFPIVTGTPREVTGDLVSSSYRNISNAARNLPEAIAARARDEGTYVFTLGMGDDLKKKIDGEIGENILKCMANVADGPSNCYNPAKKVGMYCYAATEADLTPCFSRLASAILRISK